MNDFYLKLALWALGRIRFRAMSNQLGLMRAVVKVRRLKQCV